MTNLNANPLFRAHSIKYLRGPDGIIENPNLYRDRRPRDMPLQVHDALRQWFVSRFGVDYRGKALFCTGDHSVAAGYKTPQNEIITLMPEEPFSVCYSTECKDLFGYYQFRWSFAENPITRLTTDLDKIGFIHADNSGLAEAAASGHEVMVLAKRFRYQVVGSKIDNG